MICATLVPRSVRKTCAGEFVAPWDLSTPGGVLRSHGATRRRFFFPEQALSLALFKLSRAIVRVGLHDVHLEPVREKDIGAEFRVVPAKNKTWRQPCATAQFCCSVHFAPRNWRTGSIVQPYQNGAREKPVFHGASARTSLNFITIVTIEFRK